MLNPCPEGSPPDLDLELTLEVRELFRLGDKIDELLYDLPVIQFSSEQMSRWYEKELDRGITIRISRSTSPEDDHYAIRASSTHNGAVHATRYIWGAQDPTKQRTLRSKGPIDQITLTHPPVGEATAYLDEVNNFTTTDLVFIANCIERIEKSIREQNG